MLEYKKQMIIKELKFASEDDTKDFLEALKINKYFLKIYLNDVTKESKEYLENIKSETITKFPRG